MADGTERSVLLGLIELWKASLVAYAWWKASLVADGTERSAVLGFIELWKVSLSGGVEREGL